jgi:hypothetical protein
MNEPLSLKFDSHQDPAVLCPNCGSNWTHHTIVDVYSCREDGPVTRTRVDSGEDDMQPIGNPSKRRDGLNIGFYCEQCPQKFWLCIAQHKGATYLSMERGEIDERPPEEVLSREQEAAVGGPETVEELLRNV